MAYISRERGEQLKEKEVVAEAQAEAEMVVAKAMEENRLKQLERDKREAAEARRKGEERKTIVEAQVEERKLRGKFELAAESAPEEENSRLPSHFPSHRIHRWRGRSDARARNDRGDPEENCGGG